jgi:hypothetical protein
MLNASISAQGSEREVMIFLQDSEKSFSPRGGIVPAHWIILH